MLLALNPLPLGTGRRDETVADLNQPVCLAQRHPPSLAANVRKHLG